MVLIYSQDLQSLQSRLMQELREIGSKQADEKHSRVPEMIIEFESLLKASVICVNQETRFLQLQWGKNPDSWSLRVVNNAPEEYESMSKEVAQLVNFTDWLTEYKLKLKDRIRHIHTESLAQVDSKRDAAIQRNAVDLETALEPTASRDTSNRKPTTKDQLLSKTKQVSANLIRGNQILQAGVLQSDLNLDELKQQTSSLSRMNDKYTQLGTVFDKTSQLVKTLERASRQEKRDVYLSLGFLCLCVSWVLWRRIFRLPCKLALWILFRFFKTILAGMGLVTRRRVSPMPILATPAATSVASITGATGATGSSGASGAYGASETIGGVASEISTRGTWVLEQAVDEAMDRIFPHEEL